MLAASLVTFRNICLSAGIDTVVYTVGRNSCRSGSHAEPSEPAFDRYYATAGEKHKFAAYNCTKRILPLVMRDLDPVDPHCISVPTDPNGPDGYRATLDADRTPCNRKGSDKIHRSDDGFRRRTAFNFFEARSYLQVQQPSDRRSPRRATRSFSKYSRSPTEQPAESAESPDPVAWKMCTHTAATALPQCNLSIKNFEKGEHGNFVKRTMRPRTGQIGSGFCLLTGRMRRRPGLCYTRRRSTGSKFTAEQTV
ncbi:hypothetical protein BKA93DRAFT_880476 [Sparassis latifolia]